MMRDLEQLQRELGLFSLEKTRLMSLMHVSVSKVSAKRMVAEFLVLLSNRIQINGHK